MNTRIGSKYTVGQGACVLLCLCLVTVATGEEPAIPAGYVSPYDRVASGQSRGRMIGGRATASGVYPWLVSVGPVGEPHTEGHFCGGTAIGDRWVLTAAHCVVRLTAANIEIQAGSNFLNGGCPGDDFCHRNIGISRIERFSGFEIRQAHGGGWVPANDLALLELKEPFPFKILPMLLESEANLLNAGRKIYVSGWGQVSETEPIANNALMTATVTVLDQEACGQTNVHDGDLDDTMFCAGLTGMDACFGDSGGPALLYTVSSERIGIYRLAGVVSWGRGCGDPNIPGVYVRITKFFSWINTIMTSESPTTGAPNVADTLPNGERNETTSSVNNNLVADHRNRSFGSKR